MHMHETVTLCAYLDILNSHNAGYPGTGQAYGGLPSVHKAAYRADLFPDYIEEAISKCTNCLKTSWEVLLDCKPTGEFSLNAV